jgi:hypothetical protein
MPLALRGAALFALAALLGGCGAGPSIEAERWRAAGPLPYVVCIALPAAASLETGPGELRLDGERLKGSLRAAFERFEVATALELMEGGGGQGGAALEEAERRGADLLIVVEPSAPPRFRFSHRNGWFVPNLFLWFFAGFPSFWVRDRVYEVSWDVTFALHAMASGRALPATLNRLAAERSLSLAEQGWTAKALYTPPGFHEGPEAGRSLAPEVEGWLAGQLVAFLGREAESPSLPFPLHIAIASPRNLSAHPSGAVMLELTIESPAPLERLRVELDGEPLEGLDLDPLSMLAPAARPGPDQGLYRYEITAPLEPSPGAHRLRVLALEARPQAERGVQRRRWSASQTIGFRVER